MNYATKAENVRKTRNRTDTLSNCGVEKRVTPD